MLHFQRLIEGACSSMTCLPHVRKCFGQRHIWVERARFCARKKFNKIRLRHYEKEETTTRYWVYHHHNYFGISRRIWIFLLKPHPQYVFQGGIFHERIVQKSPQPHLRTAAVKIREQWWLQLDAYIFRLIAINTFWISFTESRSKIICRSVNQNLLYLLFEPAFESSFTLPILIREKSYIFYKTEITSQISFIPQDFCIYRYFFISKAKNAIRTTI